VYASAAHRLLFLCDNRNIWTCNSKTWLL